MGFQAKTVENLPDINTPYSRSNYQLTSEIRKIREENRHLNNEIKRVNREVRRYEKSILSDEETKEVYNEIDNFKMMCGYEDVEGPGIIIEINDLYDDYFYDYDAQILYEKKELLFNIINLLRIGDVEAVSINDLRITNYSEIELAGGHFEINGTSTNIPFVIKAVGDAEHLYSIVSKIESDQNFEINITQEEHIIIPKSDKYIEFKNIVPIIEKAQ